MKSEILMALVAKMIHEELKSIKGIRGLRGPRGEDFVFSDHEEEISKLILDKIVQEKDSLKLKFSDLLEEEILSLKGEKGSPGKNGRDFSFEENREEIEAILEEKKLKFSDLTEEELHSLKGADGKDGTNGINGKDGTNGLDGKDGINGKDGTNGIDGKDGIPGLDGKGFDFQEQEEEIRSLILRNADKLKLKFRDLSESDKESLRGKDGKEFVFEENKEEILNCISDIFLQVKDNFKLKFSDLSIEEKKELTPEVDVESLKLKFSDLTEEDRELIRGPRGQRGKQTEFIFEAHREKIEEVIKSNLPKIEDLKPKFSDFSEEDRDKLKLKFEHLTPEETAQLRGSRGQKGKQGFTGERGPGWISDKSLANNGDFYIDPVTGDISKFDGGWNLLGNVKGKDGRNGLDGKDGKNGISPSVKEIASLVKVNNGKDGLDAPQVSDIQINRRGFTDEISFVFIFNNGEKIETPKIRLPQTIISQSSIGIQDFSIFNVSVDGGLPSKDNIFGFDGNGETNFRLIGGTA